MVQRRAVEHIETVDRQHIKYILQCRNPMYISPGFLYQAVTLFWCRATRAHDLPAAATAACRSRSALAARRSAFMRASSSLRVTWSFGRFCKTGRSEALPVRGACERMKRDTHPHKVLLRRENLLLVLQAQPHQSRLAHAARSNGGYALAARSSGTNPGCRSAPSQGWAGRRTSRT